MQLIKFSFFLLSESITTISTSEMQPRVRRLGQGLDVAAQEGGVRSAVRLYRGPQVQGESGPLMNREQRRRLRVERRLAR